ncbi:MAG: hypothetical protein Q8M79_09505 [Dehalococcoidia bacterium]|nr:hypothetical protein [Dehalococcoidia bacterium]
MTVATRPTSPHDAQTLADLIHGAFAEYDGLLLPPSAATRETPGGIA